MTYSMVSTLITKTFKNKCIIQQNPQLDEQLFFKFPVKKFLLRNTNESAEFTYGGSTLYRIYRMLMTSQRDCLHLMVKEYRLKYTTPI